MATNSTSISFTINELAMLVDIMYDHQDLIHREDSEYREAFWRLELKLSEYCEELKGFQND